jgi:2-(1,2-epoxy-1,2-dihydrophenyl)acetyl-CoA isomerase
MLEELLNVFKGMERDPEVRAIILTGAGKAFSGGEDFKTRAQNEVQPDPAPPPSVTFNPVPAAPPAPPTVSPGYSPLNPGPAPVFVQESPQSPFNPVPAPVYNPNPAPITPEPLQPTSSNPVTLQRPASISEQIRRAYNPLISQIRKIRKPVIAAINGVAAGTGLGLAMACDIRYASDRARFIEVSARVGLMPGGGTSYFLPRLVGMSRAMELAFAGDELSAGEARELGLVSKVVPVDNLMEEVRRLASRLAKGPTRAIGLTKAMMYESAALNLEQALNLESQLMEEAARSQDYKEGLKAFLEKRSPNFKGS